MKLFSLLLAACFLMCITVVNADPNNQAQAPGLNKPVVNPATSAVIADSTKRPPGWDRGKKTGWQGGAVPPGQAKKVLAPKPPYKQKYKKLKVKKPKNISKNPKKN